MEKIYKYIKDHATAPSEALAWVEKQTHIRTNHARMLSGAAQGQLMRMIALTSGAKRKQFSTVTFCIIQCAYRGKFGCDFVRSHWIYGAATLPIFNFFHFYAQSFSAKTSGVV